MKMLDQEQFERDWDAFIAGQSEVYTTLDENGQRSVAPVHGKLRRLTQIYVEKHNGGVSSKSAFQIVLDLLIKDGDFRPLINQEPQIPADILEFIQKAERGEVSTYELRRRYTSDRRFRGAYDAYSGIAAPQTIQLTADEYRRIPSRTAQARYRQEPDFRAAVDALHASGRV